MRKSYSQIETELQTDPLYVACIDLRRSLRHKRDGIRLLHEAELKQISEEIAVLERVAAREYGLYGGDKA